MDNPQVSMNSKEKIYQSIDTILVPQGAEYQAVCRGLSGKKHHLPTVKAVPMTYQPLKEYLANWLASEDFRQRPSSGVLLLGLAGSLSAKYSIGTIVIYQTCLRAKASAQIEDRYASDQFLASRLNHCLACDLPSLTAINSDRFIGSVPDKLKLAQQYQADVVDMESAAAFEMLQKAKIPIVVIRAISDDMTQDVPVLNNVIDGKGKLSVLPLTLTLLTHPLAALRLIRGSQEGLNALEKFVNKLF